MSFKLKLNTKFRALLSAGNATFQHQCRCIFVFLMLMLQVIDQIFVCVKSSNFFFAKITGFFSHLYIYIIIMFTDRIRIMTQGRSTALIGSPLEKSCQSVSQTVLSPPEIRTTGVFFYPCYVSVPVFLQCDARAH